MPEYPFPVEGARAAGAGESQGIRKTAIPLGSPSSGMRKANTVTGILLLDKAPGITSNRALQQAKRLFNAAKAGHTGSLDPLATGLLPMCFGEATKIAGYLLGARKAYAAECRLGVTTDTGDADLMNRKRPLGRTDVRHVIRDAVAAQHRHAAFMQPRQAGGM